MLKEEKVVEARRKKSRITTVLTSILVVLAILLVGVRILGYEPYVVLSGSMTPEYQVGDLIYVRESDPERIEPGMVITYVLDESLTVVTHRVVEVDKENRCFYTKGDANQERDGNSVSYENVVGTVKFSIPYLGYAAQYLKSPIGRVNAIVVCGLAGVWIFTSPSKRKKEDEDLSKKGRN